MFPAAAFLLRVLSVQKSVARCNLHKAINMHALRLLFTLPLDVVVVVVVVVGRLRSSPEAGVQRVQICWSPLLKNPQL